MKIVRTDSRMEEEENKIIKALEEHNKTIEENRKEIERQAKYWKNQVKGRKEWLPGKNTRQQIDRPLHTQGSSVLNGKNWGRRSSNWKIPKNCKCQTRTYQGGQNKKVKDRKVILGCATQNKLNKTKEKIRKDGPHLNVKDVKKNPLIMLRDVMAYNRHFIESVSEEDQKLQIILREKARNPLMSHVVQWMDQSPLIHCSKCLGYGHSCRLCN